MPVESGTQLDYVRTYLKSRNYEEKIICFERNPRFNRRMILRVPVKKRVIKVGVFKERKSI